MLMELLVMILVFSVAAAACLGIFAEARLLSEDTARLDRAVVLARNAAERLKAGYDLPDPEDLTLTAETLPGQIPGLRQVRITVTYNNDPVFRLDTGWQENIR